MAFSDLAGLRLERGCERLLASWLRSGAYVRHPELTGHLRRVWEAIPATGFYALPDERVCRYAFLSPRAIDPSPLKLIYAAFFGVWRTTRGSGVTLSVHGCLFAPKNGCGAL